MRRVLVLRPKPGATRTVHNARACGLDAIAVPLFEIEPIAWSSPDPSGFDGLLLTSANAVRQAGPQLERLRGLPVYAVGEATATAAHEAGLEITTTGSGNAEQLLSSIKPDLKLLHLCGEDRMEPGADQSITAVPVYRARATDTPDLDNAAGVVALIHSPRAGRRFAELATDRGSIAIAAISDAAAEAVGGGWKSVDSADQPTEEALLALAARLCNKPAPE